MCGMILVYRYRVKSLNGLLNKQSRAVSLELLQWHAEARAQIGFETRQNQDGEARLRRILVVLPGQAPLQSDCARGHV